MSIDLKDITVALGGLLGPNAAAYNTGAGGAVAGGLTSLEGSVRNWLYDQGKKLGANLGNAGAVIPGIIASGAANTGPTASAQFEQKFLGLSITQMVIFASIVVGGLILWLTTSRR